MDLLNPLNLWLAGLVGVPILIYLINRQRYRRRRWAAMEFLLRALKRTRRRLAVENLLLLLIRIAVLLFLVLGVSRPAVRNAPWARGPRGSQNWVLVLDTSYSMGYRDGSTSLFDAARATMRDMVEQQILEDGDRVALMTLAHDPRVLVRSGHLVGGALPAEPGAQRRQLLDEIDDVRLTNQPARLIPSLRLLEELGDEFTDGAGQPEPVNVVLFTDLQRKDWTVRRSDAPADSGPGRDLEVVVSPEVGEIFKRLAARGASVSVARLTGADRTLNVAVTGLVVEPELVAVGVPVQVRITVRNFGERDAEGLDLTLRVDPGEEGEEGESSEAQLGEVVRVAAGEEITRSIPMRFDAPGYHSVVAEVRSDNLFTDNRRQLVVRVLEDVEVLLVDGEPAVNPIERETIFLEVALEPRDDAFGRGGPRYTPFRPTYVAAQQLSGTEWKRYAVVICANVPDFAEPELAALEAYVNEGGSLIGFLGPRVRREYYNDRLYRQGQGLLPLPLGEERGSEQVPVYLQFHDTQHPVAQYFLRHQEQTYLSRPIVPFYFFVSTPQPAPESAVRVLCRYNDIDSSPAVFDGPFGAGRVLWVTSTADKTWNELPVWQDFVVFLYESMYYLVSFRQKSDNLVVGEGYSRLYDSEEYAQEVLLKAPPDGVSEISGPRLVRLPMREVAQTRRFEVRHDDTSVPGLYRLELRRSGPAAESALESFAVNVDTTESDLKSLLAEEFESFVGVKVSTYDGAERSRALTAQADLLRNKEYWPWCIAAVVALLFAETALAQLFARRSR